MTDTLDDKDTMSTTRTASTATGSLALANCFDPAGNLVRFTTPLQQG